MNKAEIEQAKDVILALRGFELQIIHITNLLENKNTVTPEEKTELQSLFSILKNSLKTSAKYGTVCGSKRKQNSFEEHYFQPAVSSAYANINIAVNSHPIKSNWLSCLYGINIDITDLLRQLEAQLQGA